MSLTEEEERGAIRDARGLLHRVRHDDDGVVALELADQVFDLRGRDRVEGRRRLVHQDHLGFDRQHSGDAHALLLSAREVERRFEQPVLHLVPERGAAQARSAIAIELRAVSWPSPCMRGP
jgi:hypothetical protein